MVIFSLFFQIILKCMTDKLNNFSYAEGCTIPDPNEHLLPTGTLYILFLMNYFVILFQLYTEYDVVMNCTGLLSKDLLKDEQIQPARGQITRVRNGSNNNNFNVTINKNLLQ